jgi:predicted nucleic acid-binding protein
VAVVTEKVPLRDVFLDTSVLLSALIDFGVRSAAPLALFEAIVASRDRRPKTAWHCCLEVYSVATRLPEEFRLKPSEVVSLLEAEIMGRFDVLELPPPARQQFFRDSARDGVAGGRLYDAHIAATARASRARLIVTDNRRDFTGLERDGIRVVDTDSALRLVERGGRGRG